MWHITSLLKFWFWQAPDLNVTSKRIWQVGVNFCGRSLHIVHCKLNYIYYLHNACKHNKWAFGIFFVFLIYFFEFSDGFSTLPKFALPALHFGDFEPCMMCHCQIEWNIRVLENLSCKNIMFISLCMITIPCNYSFFPVRILVFLIKYWLLMHKILNN